MNKIQADSLRRSIKLINLQQDSLGEGRKGGRKVAMTRNKEENFILVPVHACVYAHAPAHTQHENITNNSIKFNLDEMD